MFWLLKISFRADETLTDSISSQLVQHAALGDRLERRSSQNAVHALSQEVTVTELRTHIERQLLELSIVCVRHAGETNAKPKKVKQGLYKEQYLQEHVWSLYLSKQPWK